MFKNCKELVFISLNKQSLNSKYNELKLLIAELTKSNIYLDLIVLQETWNVVFAEFLELSGY